jgi:hypothetical protein
MGDRPSILPNVRKSFASLKMTNATNVDFSALLTERERLRK